MKFKKTTLPSGLRIITVPAKDSPAVTVLVMVEAGSKYEKKSENGLSHFLEHMVFKGTSKRPKASDISRELDSIGAHYNAFTSNEYTGYYAKVAPQHVDLALDVIADMYMDPLLKQSEIDREKGVIVEEIRMYRDMPQRHVGDVFMDLMYGDQPAGWSIAGSEDNVKSFKREHFVDYRSRHYVAPATTVVISGAFDEKKMLKNVTKHFTKIEKKNKPTKLAVKESQSKPRIKLEYKETDQTHLVIGVRSFPVKDKREPVLAVLATILGRGMSSRLFSKLRDEMGVCYYVRAEADAYTDHGVFSVSAGVDNKRVDEVIKVILAQLSRTAKEPVGKAELKKAKDFINGTTMLGLETSDAKAEFAVFQEILKGKIKTPEEFSKEINKVSAKDIQNVAKEIFKDDGLNLAIIGKFKEPSHFASFFTFKK